MLSSENVCLPIPISKCCQLLLFQYLAKILDDSPIEICLCLNSQLYLNFFPHLAKRAELVRDTVYDIISVDSLCKIFNLGKISSLRPIQHITCSYFRFKFFKGSCVLEFEKCAKLVKKIFPKDIFLLTRPCGVSPLLFWAPQS